MEFGEKMLRIKTYTSIPYPYPYPNSENSFPEITVYYCYSFEKIDDTYIKNGPIAPGKI